MYYLGVDTGGTFTDFVALNARTGEVAAFKVPSVPEDPARAVLAGIERLRDHHGIDPSRIGRFVFGTTVATNAVLEHKGARTALVATRGTRDVIEIQRLWRSHLFDLYIRKPPPLVPRRWRFEVEERIGARGEVVTPLTDDEAARVADLVARGRFRVGGDLRPVLLSRTLRTNEGCATPSPRRRPMCRCPCPPRSLPSFASTSGRRRRS